MQSEVVAMTAEKRAECAMAWIAQDYPQKWLRLVGLCERAMREGMPRIRRGDLFMLAGQQGMPVTLCREFRFDNNLWSPLSRCLILFRPSLARVIFPREGGDMDSVDLVAMWHRDVCGRTFFAADTWQEAARMGGAA